MNNVVKIGKALSWLGFMLIIISIGLPVLVFLGACCVALLGGQLNSLLAQAEVTEKMFPHHTWEHEGVILSVAPTWVMNDNMTFADYKKDLENKGAARRDYGCLATAPDSSYLPNPQLIEIKANKDREHPLNPDLTLKEWFKPRQRDYYVHANFSARKDGTGIAMCHYEERKKKIIMDLMLFLTVPHGGELILRRTRSFIYGPWIVTGKLAWT